MKNHLLLLLLAAVFTLSGAEYKLSNIKLVNTGKKYKDAFSELKYHLELAAGKLTPGKDLFDVKVPFSFIGSDAPKTPGTIPESGIIVIKKPEPPKPAAAPGADRKNDSGNTSDSGAEE